MQSELNFQASLTRREALRRLSLASLLASGGWPGALRAADRGEGGSFRFLVVNDTHHVSPECSLWLERVIRQMRTEQAEFCLAAGDLTENGRRGDLAAVRDLFQGLNIKVHVQLGNHDYLTPKDRTAYERLFPRSINYGFEHRGWQFVGLDSTDGQRFDQTTIQPTTLNWTRDHLRKLSQTAPTVVFTHFPLGADVRYRPLNANALLSALLPYNLQAVFSGHFHGFTERFAGQAALTTNCCCALKRDNHDGSKAKGYFVCDAANGRITRRFVEVSEG